MERRHILAADVVGYSRLIREDEAGTLAALKAHREQLTEPKVAEREAAPYRNPGDLEFYLEGLRLAGLPV